ncbi:pitrilysin family protein [Pelagicoccus sp. SDUM812002]|uniref:M16 family metallopeptidase n=1 Tax=Pelagicoccus sp. SDUM812002 TaxID=3041266 RepID=UPI00280CB32B|nr:pitrilysin family protein [Pelagicoccus sp. SDUM812002]MDQ8188050.1 pitrilysin family protein [Pelagicoccus sp. SDUM812002]
MRILIFALLFLVPITGTCNVNLGTLPWPLAVEGESPDPRVRWGALENGFRYALLPTGREPGKAALRLFVFAGSSHEGVGEQGFAHFVEHMAFNGSERFDSESLRRFFELNDLAFGPDANASTNPQRTQYTLDFSEANLAKIEKGLTFFQDVTRSLKFDPEEVRREKPILLSEHRIRQPARMEWESSVKLRSRFAGVPERFHSSTGTVEDIEGAEPATLKAFWERHYQPQRMVLFVTGDFDVDAVERLAKRYFSGLEAAGESPPLWVYPDFEPPMEWRARKVDWDHRKTTVSGYWYSRPYDFLDSQDRRASQVIHFGTSAVRELSGARTFWNRLSVEQGMYSYRNFDWRGMVPIIQRKFKRAARFGLSEKTFEEQKRQWLRNLDSLGVHEDRESLQQLCVSFEKSLVERKPFESGRYRKDRLEAFLGSMAQEEVNQALRDELDPKSIDYVVHGDETVRVKPLQILRHAKAAQWVVANRTKDRRGENLNDYRDGYEGSTEGVVLEASQKEVKGYPLASWRFENNVRLNALKMGEGVGEARVRLTFGAGIEGMDQVYPNSGPMGTWMMESMEIARLKKGWERRFRENAGVVGTSYSTEMRYFCIDFSLGKNGSLSEVFSYLAEWLEEGQIPRKEYRRTAQQPWELQPVSDFTFAEANLLDAIVDRDWRLIFAGEERDYEGIDREVYRSWFMDAARNGYCEVSVVGGIDAEDVLEAATATLGTILKRREAPLKRLEATKVEYAHEDGYYFMVESSGSSVEEKAFSLVRLPESEGRIGEQFATAMSEFMDAEMERILRENLSASYITNVSPVGDLAIPGSLGLIARLRSAPGEATVGALQLQTAIAEVMKRARRERVEETLLPLAAKQIDRWNDLDFIIEVAGSAQRDPNDLEAILASEAYLFTDTFWEDFKSSRRFFERDKIVPFAYYPFGSEQSSEEEGAIGRARRRAIAAAAARYRPSLQDRDPGKVVSKVDHEVAGREYVAARFDNGTRLTVMPFKDEGSERLVKVTIDSGATNEDVLSYLRWVARYRAFANSFAERINASNKAEQRMRLDAKVVVQLYHERFLEFVFVVESDTALERVLSYVTEYIETANFERDIMEPLEGLFEKGSFSPLSVDGIRRTAFDKLAGGSTDEEATLSGAEARLLCEEAVKRLSEGVRSGYLEATIVGDVKESAALESFSRTLGTLTERSESLFDPGDSKALVPPPSSSPQICVLPGKEEACELLIFWPVAAESGVYENTAVRALGWALQDLLAERPHIGGVDYESLLIDRAWLSGEAGPPSLRLSVKCERGELDLIAKRLTQELVVIASEFDKQGAQESLQRYRAILEQELKRSNGLALLLRFAQMEPEKLTKSFSKETFVGSDSFWTMLDRMRGEIVNEAPLILAFVPEERDDSVEASDSR